MQGTDRRTAEDIAGGQYTVRQEDSILLDRRTLYSQTGGQYNI